MKHWTLTALAIASPAPAMAQSGNAGAQWRVADAAMTAQWKRTYAFMKALDASDTTRGGGFGYAPTALESQRTWIAFRDSQCAIETGEFVGTSGVSAARSRCFARLTGDRTAQLKRLIWKR